MYAPLVILQRPPRSGSNKYIMEHFACLSGTDVRGFCSDQQRDDTLACFSNVTYIMFSPEQYYPSVSFFFFSINKFSYNLIFSELTICSSAKLKVS